MRPEPVSRRVVSLADRQHGRITRAQLRGLGAEAHDIKAWGREGWLRLEHRGVFVVGHRTPSQDGVLRSAQLAFGDEAVLSHEAAAAVWGLLPGAARITVTIPPRTGRGSRDGIRVHRKRLQAHEVTTRRGLRVTSLARTLIDLASLRAEHRLDKAFELAQVLHGLRPADLAADVVAARGARGIRRLRALVADAVDPGAVRSVLELRFLALCRDHGLPRPVVNAPLAGVVPDFRWPEAGLVVETDSITWHATAAARRRDAAKDELLGGLGLEVLRLTWADVAHEPARTAERIRAALTRRGASPRAA